MYPDKAVRREIGSLEVYCLHRSTGCTWTGPLSSVEEHAAHCPHKGVECSNPGCGLIMTAAMLDQHLEECSYRQVKCHHCNMALPFCQLAVSNIIHVATVIGIGFVVDVHVYISMHMYSVKKACSSTEF